MWKDLNMSEKSQIIATMVNNGIYNLSDIINEYNNNEHQYRDGGPKKSYQDFRNRLSSYWHHNIDEDDYDYEKYYNDDSDEAYRQLNRILSGSKAHFPDSGKSGIYKKKTHPTYPDLGADSWSDNNTIFHISDRQAYSNAPNGDYANTDRILNYLGSDLSYNNCGTKVMHDNAYVLPEVTVTPNGNYVELVPNIPNTGWVHHDSPFKNPNFNLYEDGGEITYDGGTLDEVVVKPEAWQKDFIKNFGTKEIREAFYTILPNNSLKEKNVQIKRHLKHKYDTPTILEYLNSRRSNDLALEEDDLNNKIHRLYNVWNDANRPNIYIDKKLKGEKIGSLGKGRSHYNVFTNALVLTTPYDAISELAHPIQSKYDRTYNKYRLLGADPIEALIGELGPGKVHNAHYRNPNHYEYRTHRVIEPMIESYVLLGDNDYPNLINNIDAVTEESRRKFTDTREEDFLKYVKENNIKDFYRKDLE